jgi:hypothetical protein
MKIKQHRGSDSKIQVYIAKKQKENEERSPGPEGNGSRSPGKHRDRWIDPIGSNLDPTVEIEKR